MQKAMLVMNRGESRLGVRVREASHPYGYPVGAPVDWPECNLPHPQNPLSAFWGSIFRRLG